MCFDRTPVLVKEAYVGEPSRAIFPLTEDFAQMSNNSWVGINGKGKLIQDVASYTGPYYGKKKKKAFFGSELSFGNNMLECSNKVQSELCLPILLKNGKVGGIIDAESWKTNYFDEEKIGHIAQICLDLGKINLGVIM